MQNNKRYLFNRIGTVSQINGLDKAEVEFELNNTVEKALLWKDKYFYNGRHIPENEHLNDYIIVGSKVYLYIVNLIIIKFCSKLY